MYSYLTKWFSSFSQSRTEFLSQVTVDVGIQEHGKAAHIILVVLGLVLLTFTFDKMHIGTSSNRIILAGFIVVFSWASLFIHQPVFTAAIKGYWENGVIKAGDLAPFFIAMGIFSTALEQSGILEMVQFQLQSFANLLGTFSIVMIPLLVIGAAVIGIHPFITIVMFGKILTVLHLPISLTTLALCLALGGSISYMVSPFAGVIMTIAKFIGAKASDVAITWNWLYSLVYFIIGISFAYLWGLWIV